MDEIGRKVIAAAHGVLTRLIAAGALQGDHLTEAHMAATALGYQLARDAYDPAQLAVVRAAEQKLVSTLRHERAASEMRGERRWDKAWRAGAGADLAKLIEGSGVDIAHDRALIQQLRAFLVAYHAPMDPAVGAGTRSTYQSGRGDRSDDEGAAAGAIYITAPRLQDYLRYRFPERSTEVHSVERLMGGYSKETYIVRLAEDGEDRTLVIRKDGYGLPTGSSVVGEFAVLREAHGLGIPVPEPLWLEADTAPFAAAFMAVGHVTGRPANQIVPADSETREKWSDDLAGVLARLHAQTAQPGVDVRDVLRADIADLRRRMQERERAPHPGLSLGLAWLESHVDDLAGRPACRIHGDFGFHNFLMRDGRAVAVLDWEFSRIGDPVEDLTMFRPFMEQIDCWARFRAAYEAQSGFHFDVRGARYFGVWTEVRNMVACLGSLNSLLLPQVIDVALSVAGTIYIPKYEIAVLDAMLAGDLSDD